MPTANRDKIEADGAETQRMMHELFQMKAQVAQNGEQPKEPTEESSDTTPA